MLTAISITILAAFFILPNNNDWLNNRILTYVNELNTQPYHLDLEERRRQRYKASYTRSKEIAHFFEKKTIKNSVLVLLPSSAYFKENGIIYPVPEPVVFYYFTGLKTIRPNSKDALKANWYIRAEKGKFIFDHVTNQTNLADTIKAFNQYPVTP